MGLLLGCLLAVWIKAEDAVAFTHLVAHPTLEGSVLVDPKGQVWHWGNRQKPSKPRRVPFPVGPQQVATAGTSLVTVLDSQGRIWAWSPQNGLATVPEVLPGTNRWVFTAGLAALDEAGEAWAWDYIDPPPPGGPYFQNYRAYRIARPEGVGRWESLTGNFSELLLLSDDGRLFGRGNNMTEVPSPEPGRRWTEIAQGSQFSLARLDNGEWYWWGRAASATPELLRRPAWVRAWKKVVAGNGFILLLTDEGWTYGLGDNRVGQLANPPGLEWSRPFDAVPLRIFPVLPTSQRVRDIAAGFAQGLALDEDGRVHTWGSNYNGELGRPVTVADWRPGGVHGEAPPFDPAAAALPRYELVALKPEFTGPRMAGDPGDPARYLIRRVSGVALPASFSARAAVLSDAWLWTHQLLFSSAFAPTLAQTLRVTTDADTVPFEVAGLFRNDGLSERRGTGTVLVDAPLWVDWVGSNTVPIAMHQPAAWSLAPSGTLNVDARLFAGQPATIQVQFSDPDGWVTAYELVGTCAGTNCGLAEFRLRRDGLTGLPGVTHSEVIPWVPGRPGTNYQFTLRLWDNHGSVLNAAKAEVFSIYGERRFEAAWATDTGVIEVPAEATLVLKELYPDSANPVIKATFRFNYGGVNETMRRELDASLQVHRILLAQRPIAAVLELTTLDGQVWPVSVGQAAFVVSTAQVPVVSLETISADAFEAGPVPARCVLRRFGGDLARPLEVRLDFSAPTRTKVPPPRRSDPFAALGADFRLVPDPLVFPAGVKELPVLVEPLPDGEFEGNEGVTLAVAPTGDYSPLGGHHSARLIVHDREPTPATLRLQVLDAPRSHPVDQPLEIGWQNLGNATVPWFGQAFRIGAAVLPNRPIRGPLPLGPLTVRARATNEWDEVIESAPVTIEIAPVLRVAGRELLPDGTERWQLRGAPELTLLWLEAAESLGAWQSALPWFVTPTNRLLQLALPASDVRFLRLVAEE